MTLENLHNRLVQSVIAPERASLFRQNRIKSLIEFYKKSRDYKYDRYEFNPLYISDYLWDNFPFCFDQFYNLQAQREKWWKCRVSA
jgi:hypothetical protein